MIYEVNYYINLACTKYQLNAGEATQCTITLINVGINDTYAVYYTVSDTNVTTSVIFNRSYNFAYIFSQPGYYSIHSTLPINIGHYSSKMFFIKGRFEIKNVENSIVRCRFAPHSKMSFFRLLYTMDNWNTTNYFEVNTTSPRQYSLESGRSALCTCNCNATVNSSCLLATGGNIYLKSRNVSKNYIHPFLHFYFKKTTSRVIIKVQLKP